MEVADVEGVEEGVAAAAAAPREGVGGGERDSDELPPKPPGGVPLAMLVREGEASPEVVGEMRGEGEVVEDRLVEPEVEGEAMAGPREGEGREESVAGDLLGVAVCEGE